MERIQRLAAHLTGSGGAGTSGSGSGARFKVALLGAAGGIGQPLGMLLKANPRVGELRCYDVAPLTKGVAADLGHMETVALVTGHVGAAELGDALRGADVVVIPAGVPRKPGMTRDDLFATNAGIVRTLVEGVAEHCPGALVAIISNPVNSTVPIAAEVLKRKGVFDPRRLFGVTTLDVVRSNAFVGHLLGVDPQTVEVPVVGGHAGKTILPILSQARVAGKPVGPTMPPALSGAAAAKLTERIQNAGTEVVEAKGGAGSATLSMAAAAARFVDSCLRAMAGAQGVVECAFVASQITQLPYFASRVRLGRAGAEEVLSLGRLNEAEAEALSAALPQLKQEIAKGEAFASA